MAVYDKHWSCNGSTSQLPYCIKKSISPRCYQHHAFRHRGPVAIRTFRSAARAAHARRSRGCFVTTIVESKTNDPNEKSDGEMLASIVDPRLFLISTSEILEIPFRVVVSIAGGISTSKEAAILSPLTSRRVTWERKEAEKDRSNLVPRRLARITDSPSQLEIRRDWVSSRGNPGNVLITDVDGLLLRIYHFHVLSQSGER